MQKGHKKEKFSFRKRIKSFSHALNGIKTLLSSEHNARIHTFAMVIVIGLGVWFKLSSTEWLFIVLAITLVFLAELFNTALEYLADFVSSTHQPLIGKSKDLAAAAVLVASIFALITGIIIFLPKLTSL